MSTMIAAGGFLGTKYVAEAAWVAGDTAGDWSVVLVRDNGHAGVYRTDPLQEVRALDISAPRDVDPGSRPAVLVPRSNRVAVVAYRLTSDRTRLTALDTRSGHQMADPVTVHLPGVAFALDSTSDRVTLIGPNGNLVTVAPASRRITTRFDDQASGIAYDGRSRLVATDSRGGMRVARSPSYPPRLWEASQPSPAGSPSIPARSARRQ